MSALAGGTGSLRRVAARGMHPPIFFSVAPKRKRAVHGHLRAKSRRFAAVALRNAPLRLREKKSRYCPNSPHGTWGKFGDAGLVTLRLAETCQALSGCAGCCPTLLRRINFVGADAYIGPQHQGKAGRSGPMWVGRLLGRRPAPTGNCIPRRTHQRRITAPVASAGPGVEALAMSTLKSAPTGQMRHNRRIAANVQRSRMRPSKFYPVVASSRRIPKLSPCRAWRKFGRNIFSFPPCTAHFLFDVSKRKWGVHSPRRNTAQTSRPARQGGPPKCL